MLIGQTLMADDAAVTVAYSPWFSRQGNSATFVLEVIASYDAQVSAVIQTKNTDDTDAGATSLTPVTKTGVGRAEIRNSGFDELVRYKFEVSTAGAATEGYAHCRMLDPIWETN